jgi:flagellar hook assembly protein FlgD
VRGSLVRTIARGAFEPGTHRLSWDGADSSGQPSSAGVYFVRAQRPGQSAVVRRVTLLR